MAKVAVLMATGYEESETLTIVDLLRRANIICDTFCFGNKLVEGMHHMFIEADKVFSDEIKNYDMLILPGGRPGGQNLRDNPKVIQMVRYFNEQGKYVGALCSGTIVLSEAKVIDGKKVTGYTGYADKLIGGEFVEDVVVCDQNIITSQGPATPYPFAFKVMEELGKDPNELKDRLMYTFAGGK